MFPKLAYPACIEHYGIHIVNLLDSLTFIIVGIFDGSLARVSLQIVRSDKHKQLTMIAHLSGNSGLVRVTNVVPSSTVNPVLERTATKCSTDVYFSLLSDP